MYTSTINVLWIWIKKWCLSKSRHNKIIVWSNCALKLEDVMCLRDFRVWKFIVHKIFNFHHLKWRNTLDSSLQHWCLKLHSHLLKVILKKLANPLWYWSIIDKTHCYIWEQWKVYIFKTSTFYVTTKLTLSRVTIIQCKTKFEDGFIKSIWAHSN
jgi:hypothetical protein